MEQKSNENKTKISHYNMNDLLQNNIINQIEIDIDHYKKVYDDFMENIFSGKDDVLNQYNKLCDINYRTPDEEEKIEKLYRILKNYQCKVNELNDLYYKIREEIDRNELSYNLFKIENPEKYSIQPIRKR